MKQLVYKIAVIFSCGFLIASHNTPRQVKGLEALVINNNLLIQWTSLEPGWDNYWKVQASEDGNEFITIGLVMGSDPKVGTASYKFKQELDKIKPGMKYYRVLYMLEANNAVASNTVGLTK